MRFSSRKSKILIVFICIVVIVIFNFSSKEVRNFFYSISYPVQKSLWKQGVGLSHFFETIAVIKILKKEVDDLNKDGIQLRVIGQKERLDKDLQKLIQEAEEKTKNNKEGILNLAISYGGRLEIIEAIKKIIKKKIPAEKITEEVVNQNLWTEGEPYPDLIIRTSGEQRTSGFLTWQAAYSELYFCPKYWPDFTKEDLDEAISDYALRQRRFGK